MITENEINWDFWIDDNPELEEDPRHRNIHVLFKNEEKPNEYITKEKFKAIAENQKFLLPTYSDGLEDIIEHLEGMGYTINKVDYGKNKMTWVVFPRDKKNVVEIIGDYNEGEKRDGIIVTNNELFTKYTILNFSENDLVTLQLDEKGAVVMYGIIDHTDEYNQIHFKYCGVMIWNEDEMLQDDSQVLFFSPTKASINANMVKAYFQNYDSDEGYCLSDCARAYGYRILNDLSLEKILGEELEEEKNNFVF